MKWTPIFKQGDHEFVVPYESMVGDSEHEAWEIAMGTMLVEGIVLNFKATNRYLELDDDGKVNVTGWHSKLGPWDVVVLDTSAAKEAAAPAVSTGKGTWWMAMIPGRWGTTSGWPSCWWR